MAVSGIIFQMITLFIMMFAGYLAARAGLISPSFRRGLSSLVLSTAFPCCIVSSVLQSGNIRSTRGMIRCCKAAARQATWSSPWA